MLTDKELAGLVQAARLYYEDGLTQAQVAAKIGVSRPQVSKMLAHAREAGIVHIEIRPPVAGDAELLKLLQQRFGIKGGIVLPQAQREALLRETSEYLAGELRYEKNIGLGWGYTLGEIAGKMASAGGLKGSGKIFPLIGRTAIPNRGYRVNELALLLAGGTREAFHLEAEAFPGSREARDAMEDTPDYRQALSLWQDTTAALAEIRAYPGVPDEATALRFEDALERQQAVGSLLSYYFNVRGEFISGAGDFAVRVPLKTLGQLPKVVAIGLTAGSKAVLGALRTGLVTHLVVTEDIARKILQK